MIDFIILEQMTTFAVIMHKHPGWVGLLQSTILESVGCIWFNCSEAEDRESLARRLREHVVGVDNNPLLIFPEGTCVNNHYTVMFRVYTAQVDAFFDSTHEIWSAQTLAGKPAGIFWSTGFHGGGQELTA